MTRFIPVDPAHATGRARTLLDGVQRKLGVVPNMTRHMARAPAVLDAYLAFAGALAAGALAAPLREQIALVTAEDNACEYCLSAHAFLGRGAGLDPAAIAAARDGDAAEPHARAALRFARAVLATRGHVAEADLAAVRAAGFDDGEIGEVIANVALNVFTNYFNGVTRPVVDFPVIAPRGLARAA
ncbi:MAG: carboxymuconolactone decarboxylase family protein [Burkholderiales bacterium]